MSWLAWHIVMHHWVVPLRMRQQLRRALASAHVLDAPPTGVFEFNDRLVRLADALLAPYGFATSYVLPMRKGRHRDTSLQLDALLLSDHVCLSFVCPRPADPRGGARL